MSDSEQPVVDPAVEPVAEVTVAEVPVVDAGDAQAEAERVAKEQADAAAAAAQAETERVAKEQADAAAEAERRRVAAAMHAAAQAEAAAAPPPKAKFSFFGTGKSDDAKDAGADKKGFFSGMFGRK